jgi:palmitoyltransferase
MDCDGLTALHWAALAGNKSCITQLLEAGADIRAKTKDHRTAQDIAAEYHNEDIWKFVVEKLGFKHDGTRLRSPLIESSVNIIVVFFVPNISLCFAFKIVSVFPWYMSIILSPPAFVTMHYVLVYKLLQWNTTGKSLDRSQCSVGSVIGTALWMAYGWVTRLRYDAPYHPAVHAAFLFSLVISVLALICKEFCDPGICATLTKDAVMPIIKDLVQRNRFNKEGFCVRCMVGFAY